MVVVYSHPDTQLATLEALSEEYAALAEERVAEGRAIASEGAKGYKALSLRKMIEGQLLFTLSEQLKDRIAVIRIKKPANVWCALAGGFLVHNVATESGLAACGVRRQPNAWYPVRIEVVTATLNGGDGARSGAILCEGCVKAMEDN